MPKLTRINIKPSEVMPGDFMLEGCVAIRVDHVRPSVRHKGHTDIILCDGDGQAWPNDAVIPVKRELKDGSSGTA